MKIIKEEREDREEKEEKGKENEEKLDARDIFEFFRLKLSLAMSLPFFEGVILADKLIFFKPFKLLKAILAFIPVLLISIAGTLLNDYRDYENDLKNPKKAEKPLITGKINKELAFKFAIIFITISFMMSLAFKNLNYFTLVLCGICLAILYYFLKEKVPFDLIIDTFLLPIPILAGWYLISKNSFPTSLLFALLLLCINVYIHGALWDYEIDNISTVKTIGKSLSWLCLVLTIILFCVALPNKMIISKTAMLLLNLLFIYFMKNEKWNHYTFTLILFGLIFFTNMIVHF
jgi:4-hydroxybenzoate polyprenyltransferase